MARINSRAKGQTGEREIATMLNDIVERILNERGQSLDKPLIQRNQNQSAVGGDDLSNTFDFSIEIKRHEKETPKEVEKWWAQCVKSASEQQKTPVLMYRKNRRPWQVRMPGMVYTSDGVRCFESYGIVEGTIETFCELFEKVARHRLN
jgi:hypothetical protein